MNHFPILFASAFDAEAKVLENDIWVKIAQPVAAVLGAIVVVVCFIKVVSQIAGGKPQGAFKTAALGILGAAVLFRLSLIFTFLKAAGDIITVVADSVSSMLQ